MDFKQVTWSAGWAARDDEPAMTSDEELTELAISEVAARLRAMGDPSRLRILYLLRDGPRTVGDIGGLLGCSQPNVSRHLSQLHRAGMLSRQQEGNQVYYSVADERVFEICGTLCDRIKADLENRQRGIEATATRLDPPSRSEK